MGESFMAALTVSDVPKLEADCTVEADDELFLCNINEPIRLTESDVPIVQ